MIQYISTSIQYFMLTYLTIQVGYLLFFSVAGKIGRKISYAQAKTLRKIRIFIPGYKEDSVIIDTAKNVLLQNYPSEIFEVVIIADSFNKSTLEALKTLPLKVVEVSFEHSTKGKALHKAIEATAHVPVDILLILDADNHITEGFLHAINNAFGMVVILKCILGLYFF